MLVNLDNRDFLLNWNNNYPLDHWYRKKYNIPFNSKQHRQISYIDIYLEWLEEKMFEQFYKSQKQDKEKLEELNNGIWLKNAENINNQDKLIEIFDSMDISAFNEIEEDNSTNI